MVYEQDSAFGEIPADSTPCHQNHLYSGTGKGQVRTVLNPSFRSVVPHSQITDDHLWGESAQKLGLYVAEKSTYSSIDIDDCGLDRQLWRCRNAELEWHKYEQQ
jgi:hypothetical protein